MVVNREEHSGVAASRRTEIDGRLAAVGADLEQRRARVLLCGARPRGVQGHAFVGRHESLAAPGVCPERLVHRDHRSGHVSGGGLRLSVGGSHPPVGSYLRTTFAGTPATTE